MEGSILQHLYPSSFQVSVYWPFLAIHLTSICINSASFLHTVTYSCPQFSSATLIPVATPLVATVTPLATPVTTVEGLGTTETELNDITFRINRIETNGDLQTIAASDSVNGNLPGVIIGVVIALAIVIVVTFLSIVAVIFALVKKKAGKRMDSSGTVHSSVGLSVGYGRLGSFA